MTTSNIVTDHSLLHVYLTAESKITQTLEEVRRLAFTKYDRDVMIDLSYIQALNEEQLLILLTTEVLLREAGHQLVLRGVPIAVKQTLDILGLTHVLNLQEACA